jgi:hypothetical protein
MLFQDFAFNWLLADGAVPLAFMTRLCVYVHQSLNVFDINVTRLMFLFNP